MIAWLQNIFTTYANSVPIEILVFFASFLEEVIPPIPAFPLTILAGSMASIQGYTLAGLLLVAIVGALGKTIGAVIIYLATKRISNVVIEKYGKYLKITEADLAQFGARLGNGKIDYFVLTTLRAIPIIPSVLITVGSAIIHVPLPLYTIATFIGSIIRYSLYLYAGFVGNNVLQDLFARLESDTIGNVLMILTFFATMGFIFYLYFSRSKKPDTTNGI